MGASDNELDIVFRKDGGLPARVTVIVTLYNYAGVVEETLDSVLAQTLPDLDLVIVEDRSPDDSLAVAERWLRRREGRFTNIKLIRHKRNRGLGVARNTAFRHAATPFVFVLDADNILYPRALEKLLPGLRNTDAAATFCYLEHFGAVSRLGGLYPWNPQLLVYENIIDAMVLMRKEAWEKVGGYSEDMPCNGWEDYEFWVKTAEAGGWALRIPEILCRYRVHDGSMLHAETNKKMEELRRYLKNKHPRFWQDPDPLGVLGKG